jgi:hypothetical protein
LGLDKTNRCPPKKRAAATSATATRGVFVAAAPFHVFSGRSGQVIFKLDRFHSIVSKKNLTTVSSNSEALSYYRS